MYSIRHYIIKYIDMIIINYDYRIYDFYIGKIKRCWFTGNIYVLPKVRSDTSI